MSSRKKTTDDSWAQNWYEWSADLERATGALVRVVLQTTPRRGVWKVRVEACTVVDGKAKGVKASQSTYWPNEKADGLQATVYQLMLALDRILLEMDQEEAASAG